MAEGRLPTKYVPGYVYRFPRPPPRSPNQGAQPDGSDPQHQPLPAGESGQTDGGDDVGDEENDAGASETPAQHEKLPLFLSIPLPTPGEQAAKSDKEIEEDKMAVSPEYKPASPVWALDVAESGALDLDPAAGHSTASGPTSQIPGSSTSHSQRGDDYGSIFGAPHILTGPAINDEPPSILPPPVEDAINRAPPTLVKK
ncbi:hypothetical protein BC834DRAFT_975162 [Gloeopeniophorella convolvens]|nr:hypothetical protein BC834DRAFT_975162 [Gloeopeniophorella convolvens]